MLPLFKVLSLLERYIICLKLLTNFTGKLTLLTTLWALLPFCMMTKEADSEEDGFLDLISHCLFIFHIVLLWIGHEDRVQLPFDLAHRLFFISSFLIGYFWSINWQFWWYLFLSTRLHMACNNIQRTFPKRIPVSFTTVLNSSICTSQQLQLVFFIP